MTDRLAYAPREVAELLGVTRQWVHARIADGTIPSVKIGRKRLIRADTLDALLNGHSTVSPPADGDTT